MKKLSKNLASFSYGLLGEDTLLIQCVDIIQKSGQRVEFIISLNPKIKLWSEAQGIQFFETLEAAETSCLGPIHYLVNLSPSLNFFNRTHFTETPTLYYSNSRSLIYSDYIYSYTVWNDEIEHQLSWRLQEKSFLQEHLLLNEFIVPIEKSETAYSLKEKCQEQGLFFFSNIIKELGKELSSKQSIAEKKQRLKISLPLENQNQLGIFLSNTFVNWNHSAAHIERMFRALSFAEHSNPLGLLKLILDDEIIFIRNLRVLKTQSKLVPGTILSIFANELHIATATHNIMISDLYSIENTPVSITQLSNTHNLVKGCQLNDSNPILIENFVKIASTSLTNESFWVKVLAKIMPGQPPLSINIKEVKQNEAQLISHTKVDTTLLLGLNRFVRLEQPDSGQSDNAMTLLGVILVYFYRINNYKNFTLKFSDPDLHHYKGKLKDFFASQLPFSIDFKPGMSFADALASVFSNMKQLKEKGTYGRDIILRYPELVHTEEPSLLSIVFASDINNFSLSEVESLTLVIHPSGSEFALFTRAKNFLPSSNTLVANSPSHIITLLAAVSENPEITLNKVSFLTPAERQEILFERNNTDVNFENHDKPIHYFFEEQVLTRPNHIAITFENHSLSYFELDQRANQVAQYLIGRNISSGNVVALLAKRSLEMVIGILGILKSGAAYLPLDPNYAEERLTYMLTNSQAKLLLTDSSSILTEGSPVVFKTDLNIDIVKIPQILSQMPGQTEILDVKIASENLAYIIYTSGTSGKPKGVSVSHRSLVNHMLWMIPKFNFSENDIFLQKTAFSFDASVWEFFAPLLCGGKLIIAPNEMPLDYCKVIKNHRVTILQFVPSVLRELLEDSEFPLCDSLKQVFSGGEALPVETINLFYKKMQAKLHNLYGPTEATIQMTSHSYEPVLKPDVNTAKEILIGKPISNAKCYVLDKHLNPLPIGVMGELYIGGRCLAKGYINQPSLTKERFISNPLEIPLNSDLYKTGDRVRWLSDGNLEYCGRVDEQVKVNGFRIEIGEVEACLLQHESISECAVIVQKNEQNNDGTSRYKSLLAYYVKKLKPTYFDTEDYMRAWKTLYQSESFSLNTDQDKYQTDGGINSDRDESVGYAGIMDWIHDTTLRIQELNPKVILEIGSGSGLILFNLLDHCQYYYATDFSKNVIEVANQRIDKFGYQDKTSTFVCAANELPYQSFEKDFDTVVMNYIVQSMPSIEYFETIINQLISGMRSRGHILIGDVRDFRLQKCFLCSVQINKNQKMTQEEIEAFSIRDKDLLISPEYFVYLQSIHPDISHIEILPKLGNRDHEVNHYRYDVILHVRKNNSLERSNNMDSYNIDNVDPDPDVDRVDIFIPESNFEKVFDFESYVQSHMEQDIICIKYSNNRIAKDYNEYKRIYHLDFDPNANHHNDILTIKQMTEYVKTKNRNIKYFMDIEDASSLNIIIFKKNDTKQKNYFIEYNSKTSLSKLDLASKPLANSLMLENQFINSLKEFLSKKLPSYMIPGRFIPLEKLPLMPNGKLDKKALVEPEFNRSENYCAPGNKEEDRLCKIWATVLGLPEDKISILDDFFSLGGHSLSALRTLFLIKYFFSIKLPTRTLFDYPTIKKLAELIQKTHDNKNLAQNNSVASPIISLSKNEFKGPLFIIHPVGGTIFWYKALSRYLGQARQIYAIQDPGIDANDLLFHNVTDMASFYIQAIQEIQPVGPYYLAGASFGATVAIEMAHQLLNAGERVNFIGLLDGHPVYSKKFREKNFFERVMLQQFQRMENQFISQGINDVQFLLKLQQHRMLMLRYYKIPIVKAKLTYFKADELWAVFKEMDLPLDCWQPYSTEIVDTYVVPGNHETMFWEPHVQVLAKKMIEAIEKLTVQQKSDNIIRINMSSL